MINQIILFITSMPIDISHSNFSLHISGNSITGDGNVIAAFSDVSMGTISDKDSGRLDSSPPPSPSLKPVIDNASGQHYMGFNVSDQIHPLVSERKTFVENIFSTPRQVSAPVTEQIPSFDSKENMISYFSNSHPLLSNLLFANKDPTTWYNKYVEDDNLLDLSETADNDGDLPISTVTLEKAPQISKIGPVTLPNLRAALSNFGGSRVTFGPVPISSSANIMLQNSRRKLGIVQPTDGRNQIQCGVTDNWAWQTIVSIGGYCTGTLISPDTVLTAGHCIFDTDTGAWMEPPWIRVHPCSWEDRNTVDSYDWTRMLTFKGWTVSGKRGYDLAVIKLNGNAGNKDGWKSFGYTSTLTSDWIINVAGYPGDKNFLTMWTHGEKLCSGDEETSCDGNPKEKVFYYYVDTRGGQSGSGAYAYWPATDRRTIYGVHTSWSGLSGDTALDTTWNRAARIRPSVFGIFCNFINNSKVC